LPDPHLGLAVLHFVDFAEEGECVDGREVIPELRALTEDCTNFVGEFAALGPWNVAQDFCLSACWMQNAREHLDRGVLAGPVRADKAKQFACFHLEGELAHGFNRTIFRLKQGAHGTAHPHGFAFGLERFLEVCDFDGGHKDILVEQIELVQR
jgi:hypothetical protein